MAKKKKKKSKSYAVATKAPTGLTVSISGETAVCSWTAGDSDYSGGQTFSYKLGTGAWIEAWVGSGDRSKSISLSYGNYWPRSGNNSLRSISFKVRGKRANYTVKKKKYTPTMSEWTTYTYNLCSPPGVSTGVSWGGTDKSKSSTFSWALVSDPGENTPFIDFEWQSCLVQDSWYSKGSDIPETEWSNGTSGTSSSEGTKTFDETFLETPGYSYTRWFRIRSRGPAGGSGWYHERHTYARPYMSSNVKASIQRKAGDSGYCITANWTTESNEAHPIDKVSLEYAITVPASDTSTKDGVRRTTLSCPNNASWTEIRSVADTADLESAVFEISGNFNNDEALFLRVNTEHDDQVTTGEPYLVETGDTTVTPLSAPQIGSIVPDFTTHRVQMSITNNCAITGSVVGVYYKQDESNESETLIGIYSDAGTYTVTVQAPDWGDGEPIFGARAFVCDFSPVKPSSTGVTKYSISNIQMQSLGIIWADAVARPPKVSVTQLDSTSVRITWTWTWTKANEAELSWADREDAWESTSQPSTYSVGSYRQASWVITGLSVGTWYFKVRLINTVNDSTSYGLYSEPFVVKLSSAPAVPSLTLSDAVIAEDGTTTCYWSYVTTDGTPQSNAEIAEAFINETTGEVTYSENNLVTVETAQHITLDASEYGWKAGEKHRLCVRVSSASGERSNGWSTPATLTIANKPEINIISTSLLQTTEDIQGSEDKLEYLALTEMPFTAEFSGAGADGTISAVIERANTYHIIRPDENDTDGFEGETIAIKEINGDGQIIFDNSDPEMIGALDDGADYNLVATIKDTLGQKSSKTIKFKVNWTHQAYVPEATVTIDPDYDVALITPTAGEQFREGDTCDIYRLSVDKPELIFEGAKFGETYVDPYPTLGEFGGHRIVTRTGNGDYITPEGTLAWLNLGPDDDDMLDVFGILIDFDGDNVLLPYGVTLSNSWTKDIQITKYLGGSVRGDWNPYVERKATANTTVIVSEDPDVIEQMRRLAVYPGICHVRTPDGSSFAANVDVQESREEKWVTQKSSFQLSITRVDSEGLDGLTYDDWVEQRADEE